MIFHILQLPYHLDFFSTSFCNLKWWELPDIDHCGWRRKSGLKITNSRKELGHCSGERTGVVTRLERELVLCVGYRSNPTRCYLQKDVYSAGVVRAGISVLSLYFWGQGKSPALIEEIAGVQLTCWRCEDTWRCAPCQRLGIRSVRGSAGMELMQQEIAFSIFVGEMQLT